MDIRRGENALLQLEKGSVSLKELLQDLQELSGEVSELKKVQNRLDETDAGLRRVINDFDEKLLNALAPSFQETSIRMKDTSESIISLRGEVTSQLTSLGSRIERMESQQSNLQNSQKVIFWLSSITCLVSIAVLFLNVKQMFH